MAILYPFGTRKPNVNAFKNELHLTSDNEIFEMLAYSYALNHPSMNTSDCNPLRMLGNKSKYPVINSAFYNQTNGSMADYNYYFTNCFELSVHLACCAYPKSKELKHYWTENKVPLINFLRFVSSELFKSL